MAMNTLFVAKKKRKEKHWYGPSILGVLTIQGCIHFYIKFDL